MRIVRVQSRRIGVVVIHDGQREPGLKRPPDVEAAPLRAREVGRALGRDDAFRADRSRRIQPYCPDGGTMDSGELQDMGQRPGQCLDRAFRAVPYAARGLDHSVHQEPAGRVEHCRVDRCTAIVKAGYKPPAGVRHRLPPRLP